jgi:hypothetical protein
VSHLAAATAIACLAVSMRGGGSEMVSDTESEVNSERPIESLYEQDFYALRDECLQNKILFEDPEFLPREEFLRERSKQHQDIVWLRPSDLSRPDVPILVSNKNEGFDIKHGLDSWFVPAFSAIADSTALLNHVIPPDQGFSQHENYSGIFHFRFWFGRWIEIVIDDLLPTRKGCLIYMKSTSNVEYWPALLEKAYAKAKGTYELLNNWLPIDACIELTGGCPERVKNISTLLKGKLSLKGRKNLLIISHLNQSQIKTKAFCFLLPYAIFVRFSQHCSMFKPDKISTQQCCK